jgi:hypothetical protein
MGRRSAICFGVQGASAAMFSTRRIRSLSKGHPQWKFDGNLMCPTFEPSLRCFHTIDGRDVTICHLFVKLGKIEFCGDSPHKLAGQTVPLQPFPGDDE